MRIHKSSAGRTTAKLIFAACSVIIAIDTVPLAMSSGSGPFSFIHLMKSTIRPSLRPIGLWQAEWRLFAPDPVISNCWWTIEATGAMSKELQNEPRPAGQQSTQRQESPFSWNSPFWGEVGPAEKFFKRRHIAYSRRLSEFPVAVIEDFADCWVRERFGNRLHALGNVPLENGLIENATADVLDDSEPCLLELNVFRNELKLALPDDGSLPTREETVWLSVTEKYLRRRYGQ